MKVFTLTLVALLLVATFAQAAKVRRGEKRSSVKESNPLETEDEISKTDISEADTDKKEKEIHKRGIFHHGSALASTGSLWPKTYASHYGYGLHLAPAASSFAAHPLTATHLHASPVLKYGHGHGFHYKTLASAPTLLSGVPSFSSALPSFASVSPAVSHVHPVATTQPFIIRPGGAVVQSYSVTYPHRKPALAVKPVQSFASVAPIHHVPAVQPAVAAVQPVHAFQTVQTVQHVQPVQPAIQHFHPAVAAIQPVQPAVAAVQPVHHFTPVQTVQHLPPVSPPVQTVVQTSFIPPAPAAVPSLPQAPAVAFSPVQPAFPNIPNFPNPPVFPTLPSIPNIPTIPAQPSVPDIPAIPSIPTIPSIPNFPQPQVPTNGFFPVSVQPPLNQKPPAFASVHPQAQFPGFGPIAGSNPDFGSADAAPQIPVQPVPSPEPELPLPQPEATQTPWKPVLYEPPTAESPLGRPSHTLLPPYGNAPAEGYLPPAPSSHSSGRLQQEYTIDNSLFDNLSDSDIQQIFSQASVAAHRDHHHHTVHNYHTRY